MVHLDFKTTNNMAEYEILLFGLSIALSLGVRQLLVKGDSQLIVKQVKGDCSYNDPQLAAYLLHTHKLKMTLRSWTCSTFPVQKMQWLMTCQLRPPLRLLFQMECWKEDCDNL
jgi:ribonuclease HI